MRMAKGGGSESVRISIHALEEQLQNSHDFSQLGKVAIETDPQESSFLSA